MPASILGDKLGKIGRPLRHSENIPVRGQALRNAGGTFNSARAAAASQGSRRKPLNFSLSFGRADSIRTRPHNNTYQTRVGVTDSWTRQSRSAADETSPHGAITSSSASTVAQRLTRPLPTHHSLNIPSLLESDDSTQILRPFAAPMDEPLSPFPATCHSQSRDGSGLRSKAAENSPIRHLPQLDSPTSSPSGNRPSQHVNSFYTVRRNRTVMSSGFDAAIDLDASAPAIAEARMEISNRKKKFSPGDRLAYIADRLDFQAARQGTAYYALTAIGDEKEVILQGGQYGSLPVLDVESATNEALRWKWVEPEESSTANDHFALVEEHVETLPLVGHSIVSYRGSRLFIYGGCSPHYSGLFSHVYAANLKNGTSAPLQTSSPQPPGRARHAYTLWNHLMMIHGGHSHRSGAHLLSDMWSLDLRDTTWEKWPVNTVNTITTECDACTRKEGPGARFGHHMAIYKEWLFLAYGSDGGQGLNDMWAYHLRDHYWNFVLPRGKLLDVRVDCAASKFGDEKWLFHGGLDSQTNTMLNSFYEFNFRTHEGRILRVELAVAPLKILPALMGHGMVCVKTDDKTQKLIIFGGINRQGTIVHVVYAMRDTGRSPGLFLDEVNMPTRREGFGTPRTLLQSLLPKTPTNIGTPLLPSTRASETGDVGSPPLLEDDKEHSSRSIECEVEVIPRQSTLLAAQKRISQLEEENRILKGHVIDLETQLSLLPNFDKISELATRSERVFDQLHDVQATWSSILETALKLGTRR